MEKSTQTLNNTSRDLSQGPFLFVVNPNGGRGAYLQFLECFANSNVGPHTAIESTSTEHMIELAQECVGSEYKACIAVGGDGTVHGIANELIGTNVALGIIPTGSGNGIARHLGISMDVPTAFQQMLNPSVRTIDTLKINDRNAIGFCGIGFDGFVAKRFDEASGRGFGNYIKLTTEAFGTYKPKIISIDGHLETYYSVIISNVSQLGNDAFINPEAIDDDGAFEMIKISPPLWADIPGLVTRLFNKTFHQARCVNVSRHKDIKIENPNGMYVQIDGEPAGCIEHLHIKVQPKTLNVLIP